MQMTKQKSQELINETASRKNMEKLREPNQKLFLKKIIRPQSSILRSLGRKNSKNNLNASREIYLQKINKDSMMKKVMQERDFYKKEVKIKDRHINELRVSLDSFTSIPTVIKNYAPVPKS